MDTAWWELREFYRNVEALTADDAEAVVLETGSSGHSFHATGIYTQRFTPSDTPENRMEDPLHVREDVPKQFWRKLLRSHRSPSFTRSLQWERNALGFSFQSDEPQGTLPPGRWEEWFTVIHVDRVGAESLLRRIAANRTSSAAARYPIANVALAQKWLDKLWSRVGVKRFSREALQERATRRFGITPTAFRKKAWPPIAAKHGADKGGRKPKPKPKPKPQ